MSSFKRERDEDDDSQGDSRRQRMDSPARALGDANDGAAARRRVTFAPVNSIRQPSDRDPEGNPVPVTPQHFGTEPMNEPPPPKKFMREKFFFKILHRMEKAIKARNKKKTAEETETWLTPEYVRREIRAHTRDRALTVRGVAWEMYHFLARGIKDAQLHKKVFLVGSYKLDFNYLEWYFGHLLWVLRGIVEAKGHAAGSASGAAGSAAGSSTHFVKLTLKF